MKIIQSALFRALCAMAVGGLLLKYKGETLQWLAVVIGVIFLASGLVSGIVYYFARKRINEAQTLYDKDGNVIRASVPVFPIVGAGSMILGALLILLSASIGRGMVVVLAVVLVLGALNQLVSLGRATSFARVPVFYWLLPLVTLGIGVYAIFNAGEVTDLIMQLVGWCMIFYGIVECLDAIKIHQMRKRYKENEELKMED